MDLLELLFPLEYLYPVSRLPLGVDMPSLGVSTGFVTSIVFFRL